MGDFVTPVKGLLAFICLFLCSTASATATVLSLDFDGAVYEAGATLDIDGATIENLDGEDLFLYRTDDFGMPAPGGFCALDANGACKANAKINFEFPVTDLMFSSFYVSGGDGAVLRAVVDDEVSRQFFITSETIVDLSDVGGISEISLFDTSGPNDKGIAFGGFSFTEYTPIPVPAGLPLLSSALMLLGLGRFRSKAQPRA